MYPKTITLVMAGAMWHVGVTVKTHSAWRPTRRNSHEVWQPVTKLKQWRLHRTSSRSFLWVSPWTGAPHRSRDTRRQASLLNFMMLLNEGWHDSLHVLLHIVHDRPCFMLSESCRTFSNSTLPRESLRKKVSPTVGYDSCRHRQCSTAAIPRKNLRVPRRTHTATCLCARGDEVLELQKRVDIHYELDSLVEEERSDREMQESYIEFHLATNYKFGIRQIRLSTEASLQRSVITINQSIIMCMSVLPLTSGWIKDSSRVYLFV